MTDLAIPGFPRVPEALHGPAHAEEFRTQVGRFGARHYHDPLSADNTWEATDESWPAVSTVKKAAGGDWSWTSLKRAAEYVSERRTELDGMTAEEIHARFNEVNKAGLARAANRGTSIHSIIESRLAGQLLMPGIVPEAEPYLPVIDKLLADLNPKLQYAEVVAISREYGYGGTLDAVVEIGGLHYLVDWKTRGGKHGAYAEEGYQAAAYQNSDYWIVQGPDGQACRIDPPDVDGLLIVSITTDSYRLYPVDGDTAWDGFTALLQLWKEKRRNPIGKPVKLVVPGVETDVTSCREQQGPPPAATPEPAPRNGGREDYLDYIRLRVTELRAAGHEDRLVQAWTEEGLPSIRHPYQGTTQQLDLIDAVLREIEVDVDRWVPDDKLATLRSWAEHLPDEAALMFEAWWHDNKWNPSHRPTFDRATAIESKLIELHGRRPETAA